MEKVRSKYTINFKELKETLNPKLEEIINHYNKNPNFKPRQGKGGNLLSVSPFREDGDNKTAFSFNPSKGIWQDFVEGVGGNSLDLIIYTKH